MRKIASWFVFALVAAGCRDGVLIRPPSEPELLIMESPSPNFREVTAGPVRALIPEDWEPRLAGPYDDPRQGLIAGPRPRAWGSGRPPGEGLAAVWVDGTRVGVPSDYYYLAATGPALDMITRSSDCDAARQRVIVDHRPAFASGHADSPGDYVARGRGTCIVRQQLSRWAYFVAAPGYGPMREVGIPSSGLYLVVVVIPDSPRAPALLDRLLQRTEFGGASVADMISVARPVPQEVIGAASEDEAGATPREGVGVMAWLGRPVSGSAGPI